MLVQLPWVPRAPSEIVWKLKQPSQANRSEFTGARRVTILAEAPRWTAQVKYPPFFGERTIREWRAALAELQGRVGTFHLYPTERSQSVGSGIVVDGAGQIGSALRTRGWFRGCVMRRGTFVTIGERLHQVVSETMADGNGNMTLKLIPYIAGLADGAPIEAIAPYALMSLSDDEAGWTVGPGGRYDIAFNCEEAF